MIPSNSVRNIWYTDRKSIVEYLIIERNGYSVYAMPVNDKTKTLADFLRKLHKERLTRAGYLGYDDNIDNEYHSVGTYFFVTKNDLIVLTSRVNNRADSGRFPFEMGKKPDGTHYILQEPYPTSDINTYSLVPGYRKQAMPLLLAAFGKYFDQTDIQKAFCLVDIENKVIQKIYSDEAKFVYSEAYTQPIIFPSFIHESTLMPVKWKIMECGTEVGRYFYKLYQSLSNDSR